MIRQSYDGGEQRIELEVNIDGIYQSIDRAIPSGLILNELISNALRHAFPSAGPAPVLPYKTWRIWVECRNEGERLRLTVGDNGVGLPPETNFRESKSLGLQLVSLLCDQIGADLTVESREGTKIEIRLSL